ncbi:MAG: NHL repeat-containing protein [Candidatus Saccharimonadota bacterium]
MHTSISKKQNGFTIVELLIVIIVIAILAAITVVGYGAIQRNARISAVKTDLKNNVTQLEVTLGNESNYPVSSSQANNGQGLKTSAGNTIQYAYIASENFYCMTITSDDASIPAFRIDSIYKTVYEGPCKGQSAVSELPAITGDSQLLAGSGTAGATNGASTSAQLNAPVGVAADYEGNVYVADTSNHRIRKVAPDGSVTTFAGSGTAGSANGTGAAAQFNNPTDVAIGPMGNIYVADSSNHRIRKITPAGVVTTFAGSGTAGTTNGSATVARFNLPRSLAADASGNIYVADTTNHRIRKVTPAGEVSTFAGSGTVGTTNGSATAARFSSPDGIALDKDGNAYVADRGNNRIRKVTTDGTVSTLAGTTAGSANGTGTAAQFTAPRGVAVDAEGNVFVADTGNNRIRKITPAGVVTYVSGSGTAGFANGASTAAQFSGPAGIAISPLGKVYVGDTINNRIRVVQ